NTPTLPSFDQWVPVRLDAVTIENSRVLAGSILVRNLDFHKTVTVRYSVDNWSTTAEVPATFANVITPSGHGFAGIDRFLFRIDLGKEFSASALKGNFSFALRYEVGGQTYWDNNQGSNYNLELT
ncbi:putative phosphatase regulatory subunit, partial [Fimicolochytrium jonesii]|uniref:putative phosphatase regulatory subunit n=1 Tax=Fimicolochytrium jonesii TaxID=1396493 RepID=UPI0022FF364D